MHAYWFWEAVSGSQKYNLNQIVYQLMSDFISKVAS